MQARSGTLSLTCKRLKELASDGRHWQTEVHRTRASYYFTELCFDAKGKPSEVQEVLKQALKSVSDIRMVSDEMYNGIFKTCGPVVATLFKMIKNTRYEIESGHPRETCSTETNTFELHLPGGRKMKISGSHFHDDMHNYDREITITVSMEGKEYTCEISGRCYPTDAYYYPEEIEEVKERCEALREPYDIIHQEIGESQPPLGPSFFYWFANIDWSSPPLSHSSSCMGLTYVFKDLESNKKTEASKSEMNKLRDETCSKRSETMKSWKKKFGNEFAADTVVDTLGVLIRRCAEKSLQSLTLELERISNISHFMAKYVHKLVKLMIRSTIFDPHPEEWTGSVADKHVHEYIALKTKSGLVDMSFYACNDGSSYPCWLEFELQYNAPDGQGYTLSNPRTYFGAGVERKKQEERILTDEFFMPRSEMKKLQALTDCLQDEVNAHYGDEKDIPQLTNAFVFSYLVCATNFNRYCCDPDYFPKKSLDRLRNDFGGDNENSDSSYEVNDESE